MNVKLDDLEPADNWLLDRWSWEQVETVLRGLETGMDCCLKTCTSRHYSTGTCIDAQARWDRHLAAHDSIRKWARCSVPAWVYEGWFGEQA
jgi:hypothetical protein